MLDCILNTLYLHLKNTVIKTWLKFEKFLTFMVGVGVCVQGGGGVKGIDVSENLNLIRNAITFHQPMEPFAYYKEENYHKS